VSILLISPLLHQFIHAQLRECETYDWTAIADAAPWGARRYHSVVRAINDSILVMGVVFTNYQLQSDVWRSTDGGLSWVRVNDHVPFGLRMNYQVVTAYDDSVLVVGGESFVRGILTGHNDVWRSQDAGATFVQQTTAAGWCGRRYHMVVSVNNQPNSVTLLFGGECGSQKQHDVWQSTDLGVSWNLVTAAAPWSSRSRAGALFHSGAVVMVSGVDSGNSLLNDIWATMDAGYTWTQITTSLGWAGHMGSAAVDYCDNIVILGGVDWKSENVQKMWVSSNMGLSWTEITWPQLGSSEFHTSSGSLRWGSPCDWRHTVWLDKWVC